MMVIFVSTRSAASMRPNQVWVSPRERELSSSADLRGRVPSSMRARARDVAQTPLAPVRRWCMTEPVMLRMVPSAPA
jgi:hypothetical protein